MVGPFGWGGLRLGLQGPYTIAQLLLLLVQAVDGRF